MKVNILSKGFSSYNGMAFVFPLLANADRLRELGVDIKFYDKPGGGLMDCDCLIVESKFTKAAWSQPDKLFELLQRLKTPGNKLLFFDLGDGTASWCLGVLPHVDALFKSYLFKDRGLYTQPLYGGRIWTDYYHRQDGITDDGGYTAPATADPALLGKIRLGYGAGLSNYAQGSWLFNNSKLSKAVRRSFTLARCCVRPPTAKDFFLPSAQRELPLSCRVTTRYSTTVAYQRQRTVALLQDYLSHERINRRAYFQEMQRAKAVLSPFGWGEINYKDYEVAHCGAVLLKPDISHLETWPPLLDDRSVVQYRWDFSDLSEKVEDIIGHYHDYLDYATTLQERYKHYVATQSGQEEFCQYFKAMLDSV